jgi:hypothetical protein
MSDIMIRHAYPYGRKDLVAKEDRRAPVFTVAKGMSEWEVIALFSRQMYSLVPYIDEKNRINIQEKPVKHRFYFSNEGAADKKWSPYISLEIDNNPGNVFSHIYVTHPDGSQVLVENRRAGSVVRRRFLSPSTEWALFPRRGAEDLIKDSMDKKLILKLEVPGFLDCEIGDKTIIKESSPLKEFTVIKSELLLDGDIKTVLTLRSDN